MNPPGPDSGFFFGLSKRVLNDSPNLAFELFEQYGDVVKIPIGFVLSKLLGVYKNAYVFFHPIHVKEILENGELFVRSTYLSQTIDLLAPSSIFKLEGEKWRPHRIVIQPAFHPKMLESMMDVFQSEGELFAEKLLHNSQSNKMAHLSIEAPLAMTRVVTRTLFGFEIDPEGEYFIKQMVGIFTEARQVSRRYGHTKFSRYFMPKKLRDKRDLFFFYVRKQIKLSLAKPPEERKTLLDLIVHSDANPPHKRLNEMEIIDDAATFLFASSEATSNALRRILLEIALRPELQKELREEARAFVASGATGIEANELRKLKNVLMECMRLYPPIGTLGRMAVADCEVGGYHIPKGSIIAITALVTHRHPGIWKNPMVFDPHRFEDPKLPTLTSKFALFPFGGGRHICPARDMAFLEIVVATAKVLAKTEIELVENFEDYREFLRNPAPVDVRVREAA